MEPTRPTTEAGIGGETAEVTTAAGGREATAKVFFGRIVCVLGLISAVVGAFGLDASLEAVGLLLGVVGYALGASKLGTVTVVLSMGALIFLLAASQGYVPGPWPMDPLAL